MKRFKYKWQAELYLWFINIYIPLKIKYNGNTLLHNRSEVLRFSCLYKEKPWMVFKAFTTQELIDDLNALKAIDISEEIENILKKEIENETRNDK